MSILFDDKRPIARPRGRSTTGLWLSVGLHVIAAVVLIVDPIRAFEKRPMPATALLKLPPVPLVAPRLPAPAPPKPIRDLARVEEPKPLPVVAKPIEPA